MLSGLGTYSVAANREGNVAVRSRSEQSIVSTGNHRVVATIKPKKVQGSFDGSSGSSSGGSSGGFQATSTAIKGLYNKGVLDDFLAHEDEMQMRMQYLDMYRHDAISGTAVDLMSEIPFSDFTLNALPEQEMLQTYARSMEAINIKQLLPEATREYNVFGAFVGAMNFSDDKKQFTSIMPQDINNTIITPLPIYGRDPVIDIKIPPHLKKLIQSDDPRIKEAFEKYGESWVKIANEKVVRLDPADTLYVPRRTFSTTSLGSSIYRRMMAVWMIEKALLRGTIDLAWRRQRAVLQVIAGDEEWEPTNAELTEIVNMFIQADVDPTGAIVGTRPGISTQEFRQGGDFWRYDEMYDALSSMKMRCLGISDTFMSSEATLSNMETSLSIFLDQIRAYREHITRKVFYNRLFPRIALENGYIRSTQRFATVAAQNPWVRSRKNKKGEKEFYSVISSDRRFVHMADDNEDVDVTTLLMPKVQWHKTLKPEADDSYLAIMGTLAQAGLPIPLRMWAAAGGMSLTEIMASLDDDVKLRKKVAKYQSQLPQSPTDQANQMFQQAASFVKKGHTLENSMVLANNMLNPANPNGLVGHRKRDFSTTEMVDPKTKKVLSSKGRVVRDERFNKKGAEALANLAKRDNHAERNRQKEARKRAYSYAKSNPTKSPYGLADVLAA